MADHSLHSPNRRIGRKRKSDVYAPPEGDGLGLEDIAPTKRHKTVKDVNASALGDIGKLTSPKKKSKKAVAEDDDCVVQAEEKRLRRYRKHPPKSYLEIKVRALTQRLTIQNRERLGTDDAPKEKVLVAGTTGNLYTVDIGLVPQCDCPHAEKGNQCKHIIYVMLRVLKAPEHLAYQLALTTSELRQVFEHAPPIPKADAEAEESDGNRKPIEGECPICYTEFEPLKEKIVYCKAACGNNVHDECMRHWMQARQGKATCPYCRAAWAESELTGGKVNIAGATRNAEGYINVASQLGLSGERDYSTYHRPWVNQRFGSGGYGGSGRSRHRRDGYEYYDDFRGPGGRGRSPRRHDTYADFEDQYYD